MWSSRKRFFYISIFLVIVLVIVGLFIWSRQKAPSCFDNEQNQNELGVDCGGVCSNVCSNEAVDLIKLWARTFRVSVGNYGTAALIENPNIFGAKEINYRFQLYDRDNLLVNEREGKTYLNPDERFIIYEPNIPTGSRDVVRVFFELKDEENIIWKRLEQALPKVDISVRNKRIVLEPSPKVAATIENKSFFALKNIELTAVVFAEDQNAIAASKTVVASLNPDEVKEIFFTWPEAFTRKASYVEIFSRVNRLSE